jgi:eukaryotic-like serine/threonine-protein kinase
MPIFTVNVPIETEIPQVEVLRLPPGQHRFQLVVEDESGNRSRPDTARVTVAAPNNLVVVPSVVQRRLDEARLILVNAGLGIEIADRVLTNNQEENTILRQLPAADSRVERGTTIRLTIAIRIATVTVPRVIGRSAEDAKRALSEVGLQMSVTAQVPSPLAEGTVLFQNPLPGVPAPSESIVQVTISRRLI